MLVHRRNSLELLGAGLLAAIGYPAIAQTIVGQPGPSGGPHLLQVRKGAATVTILGFGEARDDSWFSPSVKAAFDASSQLWLENAPPGMSSAPDSTAAKRIDELSHNVGISFYDCLTPEVAKKARERVSNLGIQEKEISSLRPWRAYYVIMSAYFRKHPQAETKYVDEFLAKRAVAEGKKVEFESPSYLKFVEFMAQLSPTTQNQYISWLLTFLDEQDQGLTEKGAYDWTLGRGPKMTRSLKRMIAMPELYSAMQRRRNQWWANKIVELLDAGSTAFIGIGYLHIIGPAGIPEQLHKLGRRVHVI